ncbi:hypothetical protein ACNGTO_02995 [Bisgaard Taxon 45]
MSDIELEDIQNIFDLEVYLANVEDVELDLSDVQGMKGDKGDKGEPGAVGPRGEAGPRGATGERGPQGIQGPKGEPGERGPQGIQGPQGDRGKDLFELARESGFQGSLTDYLNNVQIIKGDKGEPGDTGPIGPAGPTGPIGPRGEAGPAGAMGPTGATGPAGAVGPKGDTGPIGPAGPAGLAGKSAYQSARDNGFSGTEQEWVASLSNAETVNRLVSREGGLYTRKRNYYYAMPSTSGTVTIDVRLPPSTPIVGVVTVLAIGSWGGVNASGLVEVQGSVGINPGNVWGQSLKCTRAYGNTSQHFYVEPKVYMGENNTPYIRIHKRTAQANPLYLHVEIINLNDLAGKEVAFNLGASGSATTDIENIPQTRLPAPVSDTNTDDSTAYASAKAVKIAYDEAVEAAKKGMPLGAIVAFPKGVNPQGYLKAIGGAFNQATYPDLYVANGNSNILPNLNRSDVGMTAYFAVDQIPDGWIAFDSIRTTVTQGKYPELYAHLVAKYGSISNVPLAEDRFIRNAGNGLNVGLTQGDAIRNIVGSHLVDTNVADSAPDGVFRINGGRNGRGYYGGGTAKNLEFNASLVVPTADENRPKSIALKLCIKAKNTFDDVVFWIKAFGVVENVGALNAGSLAQDIQHVDAKARQIEVVFNQNKTATDSRIQTIETKLNTESRVIWSGNVTHHQTNIIQLSESVLDKTVTFYLQPSQNHSLQQNVNVHTVSMYIDKRIMGVTGAKYIHSGLYVNGWKNCQIELVSENRIRIFDVTGMYLKQITAI